MIARNTFTSLTNAMTQTLGNFWDSAKCYLADEPTPLWQKAMEEPGYQAYRQFKSDLAHLPEIVLQTIVSPYAAIVSEHTTDLQKEAVRHLLSSNSESAVTYFYDDVINHLVEVSFDNSDVETFKSMLVFYKPYMSEKIYQTVLLHSQAIDKTSPNLQSSIINVAKQINQAFKRFQSDMNAERAAEQAHEQEAAAQTHHEPHHRPSFNQLIMMGAISLLANKNHLGLGLGIATTALFAEPEVGVTFTPQLSFSTLSDWNYPILSSTEALTQFVMLYGVSSLNHPHQYVRGGAFLSPLGMMAISSFLPALSAQTIETEFLNVFGGNLDDYGSDVKITSTGDIVIVGSTVSFGAGGSDMLVAKLYANGSFAWARTLGGSNNDVAYTLTSTPAGDIVVTGYTSSFGAGGADMLVAKLYANGSFAWARTLGGSGFDDAYAIALMPNDDIMLTGSTASFGAGGSDMLVAKLYANGSFAWARTLGGSNNDVAYALTLTPAGDILVTGNTYSFGAVNQDVLVAKLYANGSLTWARTLGGNGNDVGLALYLTTIGDIVIAGYTDSFGVRFDDVLVTTLYADGSIAWTRTLGGINTDASFAITLTSTNDILVGGYTESFGAGNSDVFLAKLTAYGSLTWARTLGGIGFDIAAASINTAVDAIVVVGSTSSFGAGGNDTMVAKFNVNGTLSGCNLTRTIQPTVLNWQTISNTVINPTVTSLTAGILQEWTSISTQFITPQSLNLCFTENVLMNTQAVTTSVPIASSSSPIPTSQFMTAPSFAFSPMVTSSPAPASVNLSPVLQNNTLSLSMGNTMTLSSLNLNATDDVTPAPNLVFIVSQVSHGYFQTTSNPNTPIYSFTQQQIQNGEIQFVHDGSNNPPSYQVYVNDGSLNSLPQWAAVTFNGNAVPVLMNNKITITTGQTVLLNSTNLHVTDTDNSNIDTLIFTVSDTQHGSFENSDLPGTSITRFTQADVNAGKISFTHDGSTNYPSYFVSVSDGTFDTPPSLVQINFNNNAIPIVLNNQLTINPGESTTIGIANIGGLDLDSNSNNLIFIITDITGGQFELISNPGVSIGQFTQQDIINGNVQFTTYAIDCQNPTSPNYSLQASDGGYSSLFTVADIEYNTETTSNGCAVTTTVTDDNINLYIGVGIGVGAVALAATALGIFAVRQRHQRERDAERIDEMVGMAQDAAKYKNQPQTSTTDVPFEEVNEMSDATNNLSF